MGRGVGDTSLAPKSCLAGGLLHNLPSNQVQHLLGQRHCRQRPRGPLVFPPSPLEPCQLRTPFLAWPNSPMLLYTNHAARCKAHSRTKKGGRKRPANGKVLPHLSQRIRQASHTESTELRNRDFAGLMPAYCRDVRRVSGQWARLAGATIPRHSAGEVRHAARVRFSSQQVLVPFTCLGFESIDKSWASKVCS